MFYLTFNNLSQYKKAFRGFDELCALLLSKNADVNAKTHDQGYSALMFAAISNHQKTVSILLEHGADIDYTNMIGRTASQMASFVNSNECVELINNFLSKSSLEYYTEIRSINDTEPKLPKGECVDELHKLLISTSDYSPVRVLKAIKFSNNNLLVENMNRIINTLDAFITKSFKTENVECPNDILAFKLHFHKYLFEFLSKTIQNFEKKFPEEEKNSLISKSFEFCFKQLLLKEELPDKKYFFELFQEKFLRESIRNFPYKECSLIQQMVTILSRTQMGVHPSALYVITSCLNGQRFNQNFESNDTTLKKSILECETCKKKSVEAKWCTHCKKVAYCDQFCQKLDWSWHKKQIYKDDQK